MKSSTIRRSALSKESMNVIEQLWGEEFVDYAHIENEENDAPNEYLRPEAAPKPEPRNTKSQEIDLLWQTFKDAQFNTNSPWMQVVGGFLLGIFVSFLIVSAFLVYSANKTGNIVNSKQILINFSSNREENVKIDDLETTQEDIQGTTANLEENEVQAQDNEQNISSDTQETTVVSSYDYTQTKKYTIKDGDTVEGIIKKYYGTYTPERAEAIMKANKLTNLDHISIGQVLLIPTEK